MIEFKESKDSTVGNDRVIAAGTKNRRIAILQLQYLLAHYVEDIEDADLKEQARNIVNNLFINTIRDGSMKVESKKFMQVLVPSDDEAFNTFKDWTTIYKQSYGAETAKENVSPDSNTVSFEDILQEMQELYNKKNHDYGNSFSDTIKEFGLVPAVARINDKMQRLKQLVKGEKMQVNESMRDTLMDMANYCVLTIMGMDG
jgi:hypothetical protein